MKVEDLNEDEPNLDQRKSIEFDNFKIPLYEMDNEAIAENIDGAILNRIRDTQNLIDVQVIPDLIFFLNGSRMTFKKEENSETKYILGLEKGKETDCYLDLPEFTFNQLSNIVAAGLVKGYCVKFNNTKYFCVVNINMEPESQIQNV